MKLAPIAGAVVLCFVPLVHAQSGAPRAWQQRIMVEIDLPVPIVGLESANPFAIAVDQVPRLLSSTPPRKFDVGEMAVVAAYVNTKGDCLGGVPLELPFPGLTTSSSPTSTWITPADWTPWWICESVKIYTW